MGKIRNVGSLATDGRQGVGVVHLQDKTYLLDFCPASHADGSRVVIDGRLVWVSDGRKGEVTRLGCEDAGMRRDGSKRRVGQAGRRGFDTRKHVPGRARIRN